MTTIFYYKLQSSGRRRFRISKRIPRKKRPNRRVPWPFHTTSACPIICWAHASERVRLQRSALAFIAQLKKRSVGDKVLHTTIKRNFAVTSSQMENDVQLLACTC